MAEGYVLVNICIEGPCALIYSDHLYIHVLGCTQAWETSPTLNTPLILNPHNYPFRCTSPDGTWNLTKIHMCLYIFHIAAWTACAIRVASGWACVIFFSPHFWVEHYGDPAGGCVQGRGICWSGENFLNNSILSFLGLRYFNYLTRQVLSPKYSYWEDWRMAHESRWIPCQRHHTHQKI